MKLESMVPWKMDSREKQADAQLCKNDTEPLEGETSREHSTAGHAEIGTDQQHYDPTN